VFNIKKLFFILTIIILTISVSAKECSNNTYLRTHPLTKTEACCLIPQQCIDKEGNCIKCPSCQEIIYKNEFNEITDDLTSISGEWKIAQDIEYNGMLGNVLAQLEDNYETTIWLGNPDWKDYTIEFKAKIVGAQYSNAFGVQYYLQIPDNYYEYKINDNLISIVKIGPTSEEIELAPTKTTTCNKIGKWCKIKIKTYKDKKDIVWSRIYVNDIEVYNKPLGQSKGKNTGRVAFKTYNSEVYFDDLIITKTEQDSSDYDLDKVPDKCDYCPKTPSNCLVYHNGCSVDLNNDGKCDTIIDALYDIDRDTFISSEIGGDDCDDYNEFINPSIKEICNNEIDEDCDSDIDCDDTDCYKECYPEEKETTQVIEENIKKESSISEFLNWMKNLFKIKFNF
jgi:hypothetical protein